MNNNDIWLVCAGINIAIALLHIYIVYAGAPAYRYFGAGEWMARKAEHGSMIPALVTLAIAAVFFLFSFYNLAGAKIVAMPFSYYILLAVSVVFLLRGAVVVTFPFWPAPPPAFSKVTGFISLGIGFLHATGFYFSYLDK